VEAAKSEVSLKTAVYLVASVLMVLAGWRLQAADSPSKAAPQLAQKTSPKRAGYALLVGCTKYDHRPRIAPLIGPANDVELMRHVLEDSYGFDGKNIVTLSEAAALDKGKDYRPVRKSIERAIRELISKVKKGDEVVILLSGHGSQQPDDEDPQKADELDGLDEIFLPADIGKADDAGRIPNALIDDELGTWTSEIAAKGARVFLIADCCHSGTLLRGDVEVSREVPAELLSSSKAIEAAQERAKKHPPTKLVHEQTVMDRSREGVVALYAAKAEETAPERPMPYGDPNAKHYGVLTFTLCKLLVEQAAAKGGTPITFRELGQRIQAQYIAWGRLNGPTPFVDAASADIDREVLGNIVHVGRSRIVLAGNPTDGWTINVGRLHGMTKDSVLAVYSATAARSAKPLGHVVVTESRVTDASVAPVAFGEMPEPSTLPKRGVCNLVKLDYGELRIAVGVDKDKTHKTVAPTEVLSQSQRDRLLQLETGLKQQANERDALFRIVPTLAEAKWIVHFRGPDLLILPIDAAQLPVSKPLPRGTPSIRVTEGQTAKDLVSPLASIARAQNLIAVAQNTRQGSAAVASENDSDSDVPRIRVELVKCNGKNDKLGQLVPLKGSELALHAGDWIAFRITNVGRGPVDFTLLFVDSQFGISPIYPTRFGVSNRLEGSGNPQALPFQTKAYRVNDKTLGHEHLVAIAVPSTSPDEHADFTFLAQSEVGSQQRSADPTAARSFDSPIGRLLRHAMFADGGKRGLDDHEVSQHDAQLLSWDVVK
jgi:Caspase domain